MLKSVILLFVHLISLCCPVLFQARPIDSLNRTDMYIYTGIYIYIIIGERSEPPLSVELSEFSLYLYIYIFFYISGRTSCTCR